MENDLQRVLDQLLDEGHDAFDDLREEFGVRPIDLLDG